MTGAAEAPPQQQSWLESDSLTDNARAAIQQESASIRDQDKISTDDTLTQPRTGSLRSKSGTATLVASRLLALVFLGWAAFYLLTTLCAIANFAWRQPMFDQWLQYKVLLTVPFPRNAFQLANGHRPVVPNLIRLAEIHWFDANQLLQIFLGTSFAFLTATITAVTVGRDRELPVLARAAGVLLAMLGVFWLSNARMLLHGNESLHAYLVTLMVVCAGLCTWQARHRNSLRWIGIACVACVVATFSFGPGIASFVAVIVLMLLLRTPARWLLMPAGVLVACLILYVFVLPGDQGVRGMLGLNPLTSAKFAVQWLSSPWVNGWLGLADPPLQEWLPPNVRLHAPGPLLLASANGLTRATGVSWQSLSIVFGVAGVIACLARIAALALRRTALSQIQALAVTLCAFAMATAAVIGVGRLNYLLINPGQVYADRYLLWPCIFWTGLALLLLVDAGRRKNFPVIASGLLFVLALPLLMLPTQRAGAGWGATVYRQAQQAGASARSGVFDAKTFPDDPSANHAEVLEALALLKQGRLAMFAEPGWRLVGTQWKGTFRNSNAFGLTAHLLETFRDSQSGLKAAHFEGAVSFGIAPLRKQGRLVVLDETNTIVGLVEFSYIGPGAEPLRMDLPRKRAFDGYIRNYDASKIYRLAVIDTVDGTATVLATFAPAP